METNATREQALVEIKANVDKESYEAYYWYITIRNPAIWILWLAPLLIAIPSFFVYSLMYGLDLLILPGIFFTLMAIRLFPGPRLAYRSLPKQLTESDAICACYRDDFQVTRTNQFSTSIETVRYEYIKIAHETKGAFYLQSIDNNRGMYILDKKHFTPEQMEALRALLAEKFGEKFKGKKN